MKNGESELVVNFVGKPTSDCNKWKMVLVEEGPWLNVETELRRLQDRLYDCTDAVVEGQFAQRFPDSKGADILIRLDCYNVPKLPVRAIFDKFAEAITEHPNNQLAVRASQYVASFSFELNFDLDPDEYAKRRA